MAFVRIYKGTKAITIPKGAYEKQYAPAGWQLEAPVISPKAFETPEVGESATIPEKAIFDRKYEATGVLGEEQDTFEEESELEELEERPLSELTVPELRLLAESKGIDVTGLTSAKKLKEVIKSYN